MALPHSSRTLLIVDGHALLHRAFHALPPMLSPDGELVNAVYGFTTILLKVLRDERPTHVVVTFDTAAPTFRHEAYDAYKGTREEQPDELYAQLAPIEDVLAALRIPVYAVDGFEADDVIGTIVEQAMSCKLQAASCTKPVAWLQVRILTGDLDTLQLVGERVHVLALTTAMSQPTVYDIAAVHARFGLAPEQLVDYKALAGDPSDNIPGVRGIGKKTATAVLQEFGTIAAALRAAKEHATPHAVSVKVLEKLRDAEEEIALGQSLVTIRRDAPVDFNLDDAAVRPPDRERMIVVFRKLGFHSLIARLPSTGAEDGAVSSPRVQEALGASLVEGAAALRDLASQCARAGQFTFHIAHDAGSPHDAHPRAIGLAVPSGAAHAGAEVRVASPWGAALEATASAFAADTIAKTTHDAKAAMHFLGRSRALFHGLRDDTMLMSYVLAPGTRKHDLASVALHDLGVEIGEEPSPDACVNAIAALAPLLTGRIREAGLDRVYREIDLPLVPVLYRMERAGITLDVRALATLSAEMHRTLDAADAQIAAFAGHAFNMDSPTQLKTVLFEELGLSVHGLKKTAKGKRISTAAAELEKLRGAHPIIEHLLVHRELKKLVSTYVDALPNLVSSETGRIHTTFNQTVTSTGRLSSDSPNLQNIPVAEPWGPAIRRAFVAEDGWALLALDYSQFELRVAASLSGDRALQQAFQRGADIHAATGAEVFGVAPEEVTKDQRRVAKAINFGILYGMGPGTLAKTADISPEAAREYISAYFAAYPELNAWIEETKAVAKARGFVETLFGRKRFLPEIASGVPMVRAAAERMAVNMPVQGTQADLVKIAMIRADAWIEDGRADRVRMLLQVHDELVFEVREDFLGEARAALVDILEHIHALPVPIVVGAGVGASWGALSRVS